MEKKQNNKIEIGNKIERENVSGYWEPPGYVCRHWWVVKELHLQPKLSINHCRNNKSS